MKTVMKVKFGSHLYGTSTPESDTDYKSVFIPDAEDILLQRVPRSINSGGRNKADGERNVSTDVDNESFSLQQYLKLLADGQTVAIDMLFAPDPEETTPVWQFIQANRHRFLTNKSASFVGYCRTQANKYGIKGSRVAAARSAAEFFAKAYKDHGTITKVGLFAAPLEQLVTDHKHHSSFETKQTTNGATETYFVCCNRMIPFNASVKLAAELFGKVHDEYGDRARQAESNEGIDWKALSHAVRVGQEALELMEFGQVTFPLKDRAHILDIKLGKVPYKEVAQEIETLLDALEEAEHWSVLRDKPDYDFINQLVLREYEAAIKNVHHEG